LYGSVGLILSFIDYPLVIILPTFYAKEVGLGLSLTGLIFAGCRIADVITDPIVGKFSDQLRTKNIKFSLWVVLGLPLLGIMIAAVFKTPVGSSVGYVIITLLLLYVTRTIVDVPHAALGAEMQKKFNGDMSFFGWRSVFAVAGMLLSAVIIYLSKGEFSSSLTALAIVAVALSTIIALLIHFGFRRIQSELLLNELTSGSFWAISHSNVKWLFATFGLNTIGNAFAASLVLLYIDHILKLKIYSGLFLGILFLCGALSVPFWTKLARSFPKPYVWCYSILFACVTFATVPLISEQSFAPYMFVCIFAGICFGCDAIIPPVLLAEYLEQQGASHKFASGFAIKALIGKGALVVPVLIAFPLLDLFGFDANLMKNSETANNALIYLYSIAPLLFKIPAALIAKRHL